MCGNPTPRLASDHDPADSELCHSSQLLLLSLWIWQSLDVCVPGLSTWLHCEQSAHIKFQHGPGLQLQENRSEMMGTKENSSWQSLKESFESR